MACRKARETSGTCTITVCIVPTSSAGMWGFERKMELFFLHRSQYSYLPHHHDGGTLTSTFSKIYHQWVVIPPFCQRLGYVGHLTVGR